MQINQGKKSPKRQQISTEHRKGTFSTPSLGIIQ